MISLLSPLISSPSTLSFCPSLPPSVTYLPCLQHSKPTTIMGPSGLPFLVSRMPFTWPSTGLACLPPPVSAEMSSYPRGLLSLPMLATLTFPVTLPCFIFPTSLVTICLTIYLLPLASWECKFNEDNFYLFCSLLYHQHLQCQVSLCRINGYHCADASQLSGSATHSS